MSTESHFSPGSLTKMAQFSQSHLSNFCLFVCLFVLIWVPQSGFRKLKKVTELINVAFYMPQMIFLSQVKDEQNSGVFSIILDCHDGKG